jgi:hypothetical protein
MVGCPNTTSLPAVWSAGSVPVSAAPDRNIRKYKFDKGTIPMSRVIKSAASDYLEKSLDLNPPTGHELESVGAVTDRPRVHTVRPYDVGCQTVK